MRVLIVTVIAIDCCRDCHQEVHIKVYVLSLFLIPGGEPKGGT